MRNIPLSQIDTLHEDKALSLSMSSTAGTHLRLVTLVAQFSTLQDVSREEDNVISPKRASVSLLRRVFSILLLLIPASGLVRGYVILLSQLCHGTCQRDAKF